MKKADEIKVVKADIRRLNNRRWYLRSKNYFEYLDSMDGILEAIATLEKYLKKIKKRT